VARCSDGIKAPPPPRAQQKWPRGLNSSAAAGPAWNKRSAAQICGFKVLYPFVTVFYSEHQISNGAFYTCAPSRGPAIHDISEFEMLEPDDGCEAREVWVHKRQLALPCEPLPRRWVLDTDAETGRVGRWRRGTKAWISAAVQKPRVTFTQLLRFQMSLLVFGETPWRSKKAQLLPCCHICQRCTACWRRSLLPWPRRAILTSSFGHRMVPASVLVLIGLRAGAVVACTELGALSCFRVCGCCNSGVRRELVKPTLAAFMLPSCDAS